MRLRVYAPDMYVCVCETDRQTDRDNQTVKKRECSSKSVQNLHYKLIQHRFYSLKVNTEEVQTTAKKANSILPHETCRKRNTVCNQFPQVLQKHQLADSSHTLFCWWTMRCPVNLLFVPHILKGLRKQQKSCSQR